MSSSNPELEKDGFKMIVDGLYDLSTIYIKDKSVGDSRDELNKLFEKTVSHLDKDIRESIMSIVRCRIGLYLRENDREKEYDDVREIMQLFSKTP